MKQGSEEHKANHRKQFNRKVEYMRSVGCPVWSESIPISDMVHAVQYTYSIDGEFGPVYAPSSDPDDESINNKRYAALQDQLSMYDESQTNWSLWLFKDIGLQGMIYVDEDSPYIKLLKPFLAKKKVSTSDSGRRVKWANQSAGETE
jgi:hypothetical protein